MAEFTLDFSKANDGNIKDGTYEAVISTVKEDAAKTGTEFLNFDLVVRNDIDQQYKNSHVFQKVYRSKATNKYNQGMIMTIAQAAGMTDGKKYSNFEEFQKDFTGRPVKVNVRTRERDYQGTKYTDTEVARWAVTAFPKVAHQWAKGMVPNQPATATPSAPDIKDDDLPF